MAIKSIAQLKALWVTGYVPTQADFADLFDSFLNMLNFGYFTDYTLFSCPDNTVVTLDLSSKNIWILPNFENFNDLEELNVNSNSIEEITLSEGLLSIKKFYASSNTLTLVTIPSALTTLENIQIVASGLTSLILPSTLTALNYLDLHDNDLDVTSVDQILAALNTSGVSSGNFFLNGGTNAVPTGGASNADYVALTGRGCWVYINT